MLTPEQKEKLADEALKVYRGYGAAGLISLIPQIVAAAGLALIAVADPGICHCAYCESYRDPLACRLSD